MAALSDLGIPVASFHHAQFPVADLQALKKGARVSVCIPASDESPTIGAIVGTVRSELMGAPGLVDELLVVDDGSGDATAEVARAAGARVVRACGTPGTRAGKGEAMARALSCTRGDIVVFLDADVEDFGPHFVTGLLGPLLRWPETMLVKGCYRRPLGPDPVGGGRVTELVARPLIALLFPELSGVVQPLAGETAVRRRALEGLVLAHGYGVEIGMLIDVALLYGTAAIAQVDLDVRTHRNRPLHALAPQAREVLQAALERAGVVPR